MTATFIKYKPLKRIGVLVSDAERHGLSADVDGNFLPHQYEQIIALLECLEGIEENGPAEKIRTIGDLQRQAARLKENGIFTYVHAGALLFSDREAPSIARRVTA